MYYAQVGTHTTGFVHVQPYTVDIKSCVWVKKSLKLAGPEFLRLGIEPVCGECLR